MNIRTYGGQWLLSGAGIATSDNCCCDDGPCGCVICEGCPNVCDLELSTDSDGFYWFYDHPDCIQVDGGGTMATYALSIIPADPPGIPSNVYQWIFYCVYSDDREWDVTVVEDNVSWVTVGIFPQFTRPDGTVTMTIAPPSAPPAPPSEYSCTLTIEFVADDGTGNGTAAIRFRP